MKRVLLVILFAACMQSHDNKRVAVVSEDCATCHLDDYDATTMPPHGNVPSAAGPVSFPTTCGDCHRNTTWKGALEGLHPPTPFAITSGVHTNIQCLSCHDLDLATTSKAGANTNCNQCHRDSADLDDIHTNLKGPLGQPYAYAPATANFCLSCHPRGVPDLKHPAQFPRTGPHDSKCATCHDRFSGLPDLKGMNTTCIIGGCHSLAEEDGHHREEGGARYTQLRGDGSNRHFCLDSGCHPDGRKED